MNMYKLHPLVLSFIKVGIYRKTGNYSKGFRYRTPQPNTSGKDSHIIKHLRMIFQLK